MRHRQGLVKLNVTSSHRKALFSNMANSLIEHERIRTTLSKAKALRRVVEPLITLGRKASVSNRRLAFSRLRNRSSVVKLFDDLGPHYERSNRPGGYVRIVKTGFRPGDSAPTAYVELVDREEALAAKQAAVLADSSEPPQQALADNAELPKASEEDSAEQESEKK